MKRKAQADIITFVVIIVGLLVMAPIMLKLVNTILTPFATAINETSPAAAIEVTAIHTKITTFWDYLIMVAFFANLILLTISSFLVDTHPAFLLFYIMLSVVLMMFAPYTMEPVKQIMGLSPTFTTEVAQLPLTSFVINRFNLILLGIIILNGIIVYARFRGTTSDL